MGSKEVPVGSPLTYAHALQQQHRAGASSSSSSLHQQQQAVLQQTIQLQQQPQQKQQLMTDLVAGMVTSGIYTSLTYPVHRVKILLQTQDANPRILSGVHAIAEAAAAAAAGISCHATYCRLPNSSSCVSVDGLWLSTCNHVCFKQ
jgi:hypothetical protein